MAFELALIWIISVVISCILGAWKNCALFGFFMGIFLGPFGFLVVMAMECDPYDKVEKGE